MNYTQEQIDAIVENIDKVLRVVDTDRVIVIVIPEAFKSAAEMMDVQLRPGAVSPDLEWWSNRYLGCRLRPNSFLISGVLQDGYLIYSESGNKIK